MTGIILQIASIVLLLIDLGLVLHEYWLRRKAKKEEEFPLYDED